MFTFLPLCDFILFVFSMSVPASQELPPQSSRHWWTAAGPMNVTFQTQHFPHVTAGATARDSSMPNAGMPVHQSGDGGDLEVEPATTYRALSARLLYLSIDRTEVAFAAQELCRHFAHPTKVGEVALKRAVSFLIG